MTQTKECPYDYIPGKVLRHTVDNDQLGTNERHPDDLITCPHCRGTGRVQMVAADFTDWGESVPPEVKAEISN